MGQAGGGCHTPPSFFSEFLKGDLRFDAETFSSYSLIPPGNFDASTVSLLHLTLPWQPRVDTRDRPFFVFFPVFQQHCRISTFLLPLSF